MYDHCPYCIKALMIFGLKQVPIQLKYLLNDDSKTAIDMIGAKQVPILEFQKQKFMPESLSIIKYIDQKYHKAIVNWDIDNKLAAWLSKNSELCYKLAMPRWIKSPLPEFKTLAARQYFKNKKENYIGSFSDLLSQTETLLQDINKELQILESYFKKDQTFFKATLSINDFHIFAFLRSLSLVKNCNFPKRIKAYSTNLAQLSKIPLHHSIAL